MLGRALGVIGLLSCATSSAYEVLELPAVPSSLAAHTMLYAVASAGNRLVATGIRGHVLLSDDSGQNWRQASHVPVRSDLLDVAFVSAEEGWAVGHESVILHTVDGGETWERQFDGRNLGLDGQRYYQPKFKQAQQALTACRADPALAEGDDCQVAAGRVEVFEALIGELEFAAEQGADKPFFNIYCDPAQCTAIGAYGLNFQTSDRGQSWLPAMERVDNLDFVHLFSSAAIDADRRLVAGEMGSAWVTAGDGADGRWLLQQLDYEGSLFAAAVASDGSLLVGGLRGNLFRSTDDGQTWAPVAKPPTGSLTDGARLADGRIVFVSQRGELIVSSDDGASFSAVQVPRRYGFVALLEARPGQLIIVGSHGPSKLALPPAAGSE